MKLLVVVSGDYGELGAAMYFLEALRVEPRPVVLVPRSLHPERWTDAALELRSYDSFAEVRRVARDMRPDLVLLFSAYLLPMVNPHTMLAALLVPGMLRRLGAVVATSDPFLGLVRGPGSLEFAEVLRATMRRPGSRLLTALAGTLLGASIWLMSRRLRGDWRLYPAPIDAASPTPGHRWLGYYNAAAARAPVIASPGPPRWLFVLSRVDYDLLRSGGHDCATQVRARLREACAQGRRALLIAPRELVDRLQGTLPDDAEVVASEQMSYPAFMEALLEAEHAFFWNYYSFSVLRRVIAGKPVFFFGEGHMVRILPPLAKIGIDVFYAGWRPPLLDGAAPLTAERLGALEAATRGRFERIRAHLAQGASPAEVLRRFTPKAEALADQWNVADPQA